MIKMPFTKTAAMPPMLANPGVRRWAGAGAALGGIAGMVNPGQDENGETKNRLTSAISGAAGGALAGGLAGGLGKRVWGSKSPTGAPALKQQTELQNKGMTAAKGINAMQAGQVAQAGSPGMLGKARGFLASTAHRLGMPGPGNIIAGGARQVEPGLLAVEKGTSDHLAARLRQGMMQHADLAAHLNKMPITQDQRIGILNHLANRPDIGPEHRQMAADVLPQFKGAAVKVANPLARPLFAMAGNALKGVAKTVAPAAAQSAATSIAAPKEAAKKTLIEKLTEDKGEKPEADAKGDKPEDAKADEKPEASKVDEKPEDKDEKPKMAPDFETPAKDEEKDAKVKCTDPKCTEESHGHKKSPFPELAAKKR